ncbi:uncharacterized protein VNE69_08126 [Vairimorpha necatrix]|uniref:Uncharacterized protein n=1 Tax=Vairimorpha necatrix TaxID=6039 RepID=A0AAX4JF16_9MICR
MRFSSIFIFRFCICLTPDEIIMHFLNNYKNIYTCIDSINIFKVSDYDFLIYNFNDKLDLFSSKLNSKVRKFFIFKGPVNTCKIFVENILEQHKDKVIDNNKVIYYNKVIDDHKVKYDNKAKYDNKVIYYNKVIDNKVKYDHKVKYDNKVIDDNKILPDNILLQYLIDKILSNSIIYKNIEMYNEELKDFTYYMLISEYIAMRKYLEKDDVRLKEHVNIIENEKTLYVLDGISREKTKKKADNGNLETRYKKFKELLMTPDESSINKQNDKKLESTECARIQYLKYYQSQYTFPEYMNTIHKHCRNCKCSPPLNTRRIYGKIIHLNIFDQEKDAILERLEEYRLKNKIIENKSSTRDLNIENTRKRVSDVVPVRSTIYETLEGMFNNKPDEKEVLSRNSRSSGFYGSDEITTQNISNIIHEKDENNKKSRKENKQLSGFEDQPKEEVQISEKQSPLILETDCIVPNNKFEDVHIFEDPLILETDSIVKINKFKDVQILETDCLVQRGKFGDPQILEADSIVKINKFEDFEDSDELYNSPIRGFNKEIDFLKKDFDNLEPKNKNRISKDNNLPEDTNLLLKDNDLSNSDKDIIFLKETQDIFEKDCFLKNTSFLPSEFSSTQKIPKIPTKIPSDSGYDGSEMTNSLPSDKSDATHFSKSSTLTSDISNENFDKLNIKLADIMSGTSSGSVEATNLETNNLQDDERYEYSKMVQEKINPHLRTEISRLLKTSSEEEEFSEEEFSEEEFSEESSESKEKYSQESSEGEEESSENIEEFSEESSENIEEFSEEESSESKEKYSQESSESKEESSSYMTEDNSSNNTAEVISPGTIIKNKEIDIEEDIRKNEKPIKIEPDEIIDSEMTKSNEDILLYENILINKNEDKNKDIIDKNLDILDKNKDIIDKNADILDKNKDILDKNKDIIDKNKNEDLVSSSKNSAPDMTNMKKRKEVYNSTENVISKSNKGYVFGERINALSKPKDHNNIKKKVLEKMKREKK